MGNHEEPEAPRRSGNVPSGTFREPTRIWCEAPEDFPFSKPEENVGHASWQAPSERATSPKSERKVLAPDERMFFEAEENMTELPRGSMSRDVGARGKEAR